MTTTAMPETHAKILAMVDKLTEAQAAALEAFESAPRGMMSFALEEIAAEIKRLRDDANRLIRD